MAAILGIGNATLDIVHTVDGYPEENDEMRCISRSIQRGGNIANTLVVLSQFGHRCSWAGVLVDNSDGRLILDDLKLHGINTGTCRMQISGSVPVSSVLLNINTGSRTIVHYRDLPEYSSADFESIDLRSFDWLHFEGRNVDELQVMMQRAREHCPSIPRSLEVEKPHAGIENLFCLADVLLFSRDYGCHYAYGNPRDLLQTIHAQHPDADLFCTRGEQGAIALDKTGRIYSQTAVAPHQVVDTLGAGDTFNAAVINGCLAKLETASVLRQACVLAGRKCSQTGLDGLVNDRLLGMIDASASHD
ncbi:MAG: PfkB family carbohydrate kinase [Pseudomonadota bacterium]|nr:PfkB family carbohydrate kinase [Pseudomonadota bacterium]